MHSERPDWNCREATTDHDLHHLARRYQGGDSQEALYCIGAVVPIVRKTYRKCVQVARFDDKQQDAVQNLFNLGVTLQTVCSGLYAIAPLLPSNRYGLPEFEEDEGAKDEQQLEARCQTSKRRSATADAVFSCSLRAPRGIILETMNSSHLIAN